MPLENAGGKWATFIIWAKNTFTLGRSDYQYQYEPILYGWKEDNAATGAVRMIRVRSGFITSLRKMTCTPL